MGETGSTIREQSRIMRTRSARPAAAVIWAAAAVILVTFWVTGSWGTFGKTAPWMMLVAWAAYTTQWRPCLVIDDIGFTIVNGLRTHRIPFGVIEDVEVRFTVAVRAAGRRYVSWGAPNPPTAFGAGFGTAREWKNRPQSMLPSNERLKYPQPAPTGRDAIVAAWQRAATGGRGNSSGVVTSTWHPVVAALGAACVLWCLISLLL